MLGDLDGPASGGLGKLSSLVDGYENFGSQAQKLALEGPSPGQNRKMIVGTSNKVISNVPREKKINEIEEKKTNSSKLGQLNE